jgi:hypothetical protein
MICVERAIVALILVSGCQSGTPATPPDALARDRQAADARAADTAVLDHGVAADACAPRAFVPPGPTTAWKQLTTPLIVMLGTAAHRANDVIVNPGAPQLLIGKFAYGAVDKDLKGEDVEIFVQDSPPCGAWVSLGTATTSQEGQYGNTYGVEDDGGRVFFTVPAAQARSVGRHPVRMLVKGDHSVAAPTLFIVQPTTGTVVFDIDGTLTTDDFQLVAQIFADLFAGTYTPKMQTGALDVVRAWTTRGYLVLYLTGRPGQLRAVSQGWLTKEGFPAGAVMLTETTAQTLPTPTGVGAYKSQVLQAAAAKVNLEAAYGNATTDIQGYAAAGVAKSRTFIIGANGGKDGTVAIDTYPKHLPVAQGMPAPSVAAPQSWGWW